MENSSTNKGLVKYNSSRENNNFALIAILVTLIAILVTIYCCTQVYPSDLDPGNYFHSKNQSTQTDQLRQRDLGVQTVPCSQSSSASQTTCYLDITSSLRPFSDETTTGISSTSDEATSFGPFSTTSNTTRTNLRRLMKLKPDYYGPIIHGPFFCDCPGGVCKHRSSAPTTNPSKLKLDGPRIHGPFFCDCPCACGVCIFRS